VAHYNHFISRNQHFVACFLDPIERTDERMPQEWTCALMSIDKWLRNKAFHDLSLEASVSASCRAIRKARNRAFIAGMTVRNSLCSISGGEFRRTEGRGMSRARADREPPRSTLWPALERARKLIPRYQKRRGANSSSRKTNSRVRERITAICGFLRARKTK